jgi:LysM repeat protein
LLVPVEGNGDYRLKGVSHEVARPEVRLFVERLSGQYRRACGMPLVVTSLTRPSASQPSNASARSVHPTGMALDLRRPADRKCRAWLESTLLHLEAAQVLDATLERNPPHYHVAIFPNRYTAYVSGKTGRPGPRVVSDLPVEGVHTVRPKETLWSISRQYSTTPLALRRANNLDSTAIQIGQVLRIP